MWATARANRITPVRMFAASSCSWPRSPARVQHLAIGVHGAAGIVSYAQNQRSAWWGEDENLVRWGHLESFGGDKTFAFMVSLKTARAFRDRLARGEQIHMHAVVKAGQHPGVLSVVTATIPGADPKLRGEEIAYSCHLDHQRPGANDNASGCVAILEVARTSAETNQRRQTCAAGAHAALHLAARDRRHHHAAQRQARIRAAHQSRRAHGYGRRRPGHEGHLSRHARPRQFAFFRLRCRRRVRRICESGNPSSMRARARRSIRSSIPRVAKSRCTRKWWNTAWAAITMSTKRVRSEFPRFI